MKNLAGLDLSWAISNSRHSTYQELFDDLRYYAVTNVSNQTLSSQRKAHKSSSSCRVNYYSAMESNSDEEMDIINPHVNFTSNNNSEGRQRDNRNSSRKGYFIPRRLWQELETHPWIIDAAMAYREQHQQGNNGKDGQTKPRNTDAPHLPNDKEVSLDTPKIKEY